MILLAGIVLSLPVYPYLQRRFSRSWDAWNAAALTVIAGLVLISVMVVTYNPFIYFNF